MDLENRVRELEIGMFEQFGSLTFLRSAVVMASKNVLTVDAVRELSERLTADLLAEKCPDAVIDGIAETTRQLIDTIQQFSVLPDRKSPGG